MTRVKDLTGMRFGRLVVVELIGKAANGKYQWKCKCDCGNYTIVKGNSLTTDHTKSCGCGIPLKHDEYSTLPYVDWNGVEILLKMRGIL